MPLPPRPISPHLTIYKPQITTVLSITHRATGVFLSLGVLMLCWWIIALACGPHAYQYFYDFAAHWIGEIVLLSVVFSLFYHLCNGIRHLFWDIGQGFEIKTATISGWFVVIVSLALTGIFCVTAQGIVGG